MLSYDVQGGNATPAASAAQSALAQQLSLPTQATSAMSNNTTSANTEVNDQASQHHHIWLVTGPAGCGKTSVAEYLANRLSLPYIEGDSFHPPANVERMANGIPLTDADRWDWLTVLREESMRRITSGNNGVILTCSALKRKYRDVIRVAAYFDQQLLIHFVFLDASEELLLQRVGGRQNHYMGANMVHSQFEALERPTADETDVISIDVSRTLEEVERDALARVVALLKDDQ